MKHLHIDNLDSVAFTIILKLFSGAIFSDILKICRRSVDCFTQNNKLQNVQRMKTVISAFPKRER